MQLKNDTSNNKLSGTFYTPDLLAEAMVDKIFNRNFQTILEPSCGMGVFIKKIVDRLPEANITAVDNDRLAINSVRMLFEHYENIQILNCDFFNFYNTVKNNRRYDLIIGNPPYIRYQYLTSNQRELLAGIMTECNMKSNKLINAWVAFLVACINLLNDGGLIAFVIPAELLQVAYADDLRFYLINNLDNLTIITFKALAFTEVQQEIVVFYGRKGHGNGLIRIAEADDIKSFRDMDLGTIPYQQIDRKNDKWTKYFISYNEAQVLDLIKNDKRFKKFSAYGRINVGITTGNNKFFSISKKIEDQYGLADATLPLIGRSSHVHGIFFTRDDWIKNRNSGKKAMLLKFPDTDLNDYPEGFKRYIKLGEKNEENLGYKCRIRDKWYVVPSVWVPDAFFLRRNFLYPKFVLNECGAVSTDTMHRIKFNDGVCRADVLLSYYNSISFAFTEICGRSYGGGVLEILPGELGMIRLPDISNVDKAIKEELLTFVDHIVRDGKNIEVALDRVDKELLIDCLGVPEKWCYDCRNIWKKLQQRRLVRGKKI